MTRWAHYSQPEDRRENTLTHSLDSVILAAVMLKIEDEQGVGSQIDHSKILLTAAIHDFGEGTIGDVAYRVKNDPRVRDALGAIEKEEVYKIFEGLSPSLREMFLQAYDVVEQDSVGGEFFNAVECVGYVFFAITQLEATDLKFVEVLKRQHSKLVELGKKFASVRVLYLEPYKEYVEKLIQTPE